MTTGSRSPFVQSSDRRELLTRMADEEHRPAGQRVAEEIQRRQAGALEASATGQGDPVVVTGTDAPSGPMASTSAPEPGREDQISDPVIKDEIDTGGDDDDDDDDDDDEGDEGDKGGKDDKDGQDDKVGQDAKHSKDNKDSHDDKVGQDAKLSKDRKDGKDHKDHKDEPDKPTKDSKDSSDEKISQDHKNTKDEFDAKRIHDRKAFEIDKSSQDTFEPGRPGAGVSPSDPIM